MNSQRLTMISVAVVILVIAAFAIVPRLTATQASGDIDYGANPRLGSPDAPVKVAVFFDFLCPHCASFAENVTSVLRREYVADGRLAIYFANFPVIAPQGMSRTLAMVGECVNRQGRDAFGQLEPVLMRAQNTLTSAARAIDLAAEYVVGLDRGLLESCVQGAETASLVDADVRMAQRLGVRGTPTVFVDGQLVSNPTLANVRRAIEDALAR